LDLFHKDSRSDLWAAICENAGAGGSHRSAGRLVERKSFASKRSGLLRNT
jgi:hypothetical protein